MKRRAKFGTVRSTQKGIRHGTISYYGPKPGLALKVAAGISTPEGIIETREWQAPTDVRYDPITASQVATYFKLHAVREVNFVDAVIDCTHEDRNVCGCDDSVYKTAGADPMYIKDGLPSEPEDQILVAIAHAGAHINICSHVDFHRLRDGRAAQDRSLALADTKDEAAEIYKRYAGSAGSVKLWLQQARVRVSEADVAPSLMLVHKTKDDVEDIANDVWEMFLDRKVYVLGGDLWREGAAAEVGVCLTVLPGGYLHMGVATMAEFAKFAQTWIQRLDDLAARKPGAIERFWDLNRLAAVEKAA